MPQATTEARYLEWLIRLLFGIGGIAATVIGSWVASKIHVYHQQRNGHCDDIKQRVLVPLRTGLDTELRPLVWCVNPMIYVKPGATTQLREKPKATEEATERRDILLIASPTAEIFGTLDSALLRDARQIHFPEALRAVDDLVKRWHSLTGECHAWASLIANDILAVSQLPAFPPPHRTGTYSPYVMHWRLGLFVCNRLLRLPIRALYPEEEHDHASVQSEDGTLAVGSKADIDALISHIDKLLDSEEPMARALSAKMTELQAALDTAIPMLDYAIASRRLRGRCDLVTFL